MSSYEDKKRMLFDCLNSAEKCIQGTSLEQKRSGRDDPPQRNYPQVIGRRFQGKESIFKRPEAPIGKCLRPRRVPDYQTNPHKWKKYSLDDADISDQTNASAAFAFLAEMEKRKDVEDEKDVKGSAMDTDDEQKNKIVFKKQSSSKEYRKPSFSHSASLRQKIETNVESGEKSTLKGSKVVMPEYVIGQKATQKVSSKTKTKAVKHSADHSNKSSGSKKPLLQHLFDEEEEDED